MGIKEPYVVVTERIIDSPALANIDDNSNMGCVLVCNRGPKIGYVKGSKDFIETYGVKVKDEDGNIKYEIPKDCHVSMANAYYMSTFAPLVIARAMNEPVLKETILLLQSSNGEVSLSKDLTFIYDNELAVNAYSCGNVALNSFTHIRIDGTDYPINIFDDNATFTEASLELSNELRNSGTLVKVADNGFVSSIPGMSVQFVVKSNNEDTSVVDATTSNKIDDLKFSAVSYKICGYFKGTEPGDKFKISVNQDDATKFDLTIGDDEAPTYSGLSFNEDAEDEDTGESIYLPNQNFTPFEWVSVSGFDDSSVVENQWTVTLTDVNGDSSSEALIAAAQELEDQELYDIAQCATLGIVDIKFVKSFLTIAKANDWFLPVDVPESKKSLNAIEKWNGNITDTNNSFVFGPFDKNSTFLGFRFPLAPSTLYWETVYANKAVGSEFAPTFGMKNGTVKYTNPAASLKKDERERLLSLPQPVNFMIYDPRTGAYTINNNLTHSSKDNVLKEEQNRRLANKIKKDVKPLLDDFKGEYNNLATRMAVVSRLENYFRTNIMNMNYSPEDFKIVCDRTNNTDDVINANQLAVTVKVRFYRSIKYVIVLNEIYPIGVDFE